MRPNWGKVDGSRLNFARIFFPVLLISTPLSIPKLMIKNLFVVLLSYINHLSFTTSKRNIPLLILQALKKIDNTNGTVDCTEVIRALTKEITKMISVQLKS